VISLAVAILPIADQAAMTKSKSIALVLLAKLKIDIPENVEQLVSHIAKLGEINHFPNHPALP
jgi:hypothetical protein